MRNDFHVIFFPHTCINAIMCRHYWNMGIMGLVWLLVPLRVCGYHRNGEEKVRVVEELRHFQ